MHETVITCSCIIIAAFVEAEKDGFIHYYCFQCRNNKSIATCRFGCAKERKNHFCGCIGNFRPVKLV